MKDFYEKLGNILPGECIKTNEPMSRHTTFRIGGPARYYVRPKTREQLARTAMLCRRFQLDPLAGGVVICHAEGHRLGVASNHGDVLHWFPQHGKTMDDFRADTARVMRGEDEIVTYEQWKEFMERYRQELAQLPGSDWGQEELEKGVAQGFTDGQRPQDLATRQEVVSMIVRAEK